MAVTITKTWYAPQYHATPIWPEVVQAVVEWDTYYTRCADRYVRVINDQKYPTARIRVYAHSVDGNGFVRWKLEQMFYYTRPHAPIEEVLAEVPRFVMEVVL